MSRAVAIAADVAARDVQPHDAAADRRPERNVDLIFEVGSLAPGLLRIRPRHPSAENAGENVAEAAATASRSSLTSARTLKQSEKSNPPKSKGTPCPPPPPENRRRETSA